MLYHITHITEYQYDEAVGFTPHLIRLFPKLEDRIRLHEYTLDIFPQGVIHWIRDPWDNVLARYFTTNVSRQFTVRVDAVIEHRQESAFDFLLDSHAVEFPFSYQPQEQQALTAYLDQIPVDATAVTWIENHPLKDTRDTVSFLSGLALDLNQGIRYVRRDKPGVQSPSQTLSLKSGTCRDYAVLFAAVCRAHGLAARFVSGYLHAPSEEGCPVDDHALHAWTEVFLPGAGWRGIDPTNGVWCSHHHIPLAAAIRLEDAAPITGTYCADHLVGSTFSSELSIHVQG